MRWLAAAAAFLLCGCAGRVAPASVADGPPADLARGADEFWMVWIEGEEGPEHSRMMCDVAFDHAVDAGNRTVRYDPAANRWRPSSVRVLVAYDVWSRGSDCPEAYALHAAWAAQEETPAWPRLDATVAPDGTAKVLGATVRPGQVATFRTTHLGDPAVVRVHALGAWPQSGLLPSG